ncbi:hypothetical protein D7030_12810 [Flavobacteriaceae bacterium AU392]|nr:hypothetical protein D1817_05680 [Flavobacteriaceae bacterium]RKM81186.1 hypothetical protein D7030_12810 [Flavobacteriaceae bacterium AU392]
MFEGGVLWFRVLAAIINTITFIISYKILSRYINKYYVLIALLMVLIVNDFGYLVFYHNHLTGLLVVTSIWFLIKGLTENKMLFLGISGFVCAVNVFSRLPNLSLFILIVCIPFYYYLKKEPVVKSIKLMLYYALGIVLGLLFMILLLLSLGHLDIMKQAILGIADSAKTISSNHNFLSVITEYILSYKLAVKSIIKLLLLSALIFYITNKLKANKIFINLFIIVSIIMFSFLLKFNNVFILYGLLLIGTIGSLLSNYYSTEVKLISLCALIIAVFLPLGSDRGIANGGYMSIWLSVPIFFHFISQQKERIITFKIFDQRQLLSINRKFIKLWSVIFITSYFIVKLSHISQEAYFDKGNRFKKTSIVNNDLTKGVYTTAHRAKIINSLLPNIDKYVKQGDYLLAYDNIPMIHFLTKTKPYMYNPWVWVYDGYSFEKNMKRAEAEIPALPIILQQKFETIVEFSLPDVNYMSELKENSYRYNKQRMKAMNDFIKRNEYKIVWSNEYFNIYKTNKGS